MGIRIKIQLGYGLTNLNVEKNGRITDDPRINEDFTDEESYDKLYESKTVDEFAQWIHSEFEKDKEDNECADIIRRANGNYSKDFMMPPFDVYSYINDKDREQCKRDIKSNAPFFRYDSEYGLSNVICFSDPFSPDWQRHDDMIDYYMSEDSTPEVKDLTSRCGIYPNISMIKIPHIELEEKWRDKYAPSEYNMMVGRWEKDREPILSGEMLEIALNSYRPLIPDSILLWTYYIKIFKDWERTVQELRPMIYTYWS